MAELKKIVEDLRALKTEGDYWDFKREPHANNADLLHDILCLSNSLHKGDRYLIIGVDDTNDYNIFNLNQDGVENRKTQADLMDFLSSKKFAGDNNPEVKLETLNYNNNIEIDVIVIIDSPLKPYYITDDYRYGKETVRAGVVYNRIQDKNVPKKGSANIYKIEKMWRQRFGLDSNPIKRMENYLLKPKFWEKGYNFERDTYFKTFPEFNITFDESKDCNNALRYLFEDDENIAIGLVKFRFHTTTLFDLYYVHLDGYRTIMPFPDRKSFFNRGNFYYFTKNSRKGKFIFFLNEKYENQDYISLPIPIPIFDDDSHLEKYLSNLELDDDDLTEYISDEKLIKAEKQRDVSIKLTIQIYKSLNDN